jgi:hypothetical protein
VARPFGLIIVSLLAVACVKEPEEQAQQPSPTDAAPVTTEPTSNDEPPVDEPGRLSVTTAQAEAAGLAPLAFSLDVRDSGMSGNTFSDARYVTLSGPPGGPLMLMISPTTVGEEFYFSNIVATEVEQEVELLGAKHRAVAWITGSSMARTSWCAILLAPKGAAHGDPALLLTLGVGHQGDQTTCATAREHHVLKAVVDSLRFD